MRIAYVCMDRGVPVFDWRKGCSIHVQEMLRAFSEQGHEVTLFAAEPGDKPPRDLAEIEVCRIDLANHERPRGERERTSWLANERLAKELRAAGPFDLIYERYSLWSIAGMQYARDCDVPGVLEVNAPLIEEQSEHRGLINTRLAREVIAQCVANSSLVAAVSEEVRSYVLRFPNANVQVLPNGVNPARFAESNRVSATRRHPFTIGFVGSLKVWHGVNELVDAFAAVQKKTPDSRLLIVGDGPERTSLESQIDGLGLTHHVSMPGTVSPERIPEYLQHMDVGVAPYPPLANFYFSPMKVYEYMAAGLPVVVSDVGQLRELVVDEVNGLVCPAGDRSALVDALMCLNRDPALRNRLGKRGQEIVLCEHTWSNTARRVIELTSERPTEHMNPVREHGAQQIRI